MDACNLAFQATDIEGMEGSVESIGWRRIRKTMRKTAMAPTSVCSAVARGTNEMNSRPATDKGPGGQTPFVAALSMPLTRSAHRQEEETDVCRTAEILWQ